MVTQQQYQEATDLIARYRLEQSKEAIKNLRCICCDKPIEPDHGILPALDKLTSGVWKHGTVAFVDFGYGSRMHDGDGYYVAICDSCMKIAIDRKIVIRCRK